MALLDLLPNGGGDGTAFQSLTIEAMRKFNEETPDVDGVKYYSWGAVFEPGLLDAFKLVFTILFWRDSHMLSQMAAFRDFGKGGAKRWSCVGGLC